MHGPTARPTTTDIITDIDLKKSYEFHLSHHHPVTLVLHDCSDFNFVSVDQNNFIRGFTQEDIVGSPQDLQKLTFTGIQVLDPEVLDYVPAKRFYSSIDAYRKMMSAGRKIIAYTEKNRYWTDIGTPERFLEAAFKQTAASAFTAAWKGHSPENISRTKLKGDGSGRNW